jgi:hypothetical protein
MMIEPVHERIVDLVDPDGTRYDRAFVYAEPAGTTWRAWIEFLAANDDDDILETGTETTQSKLTDVAYWATGLEALYFEGAFERALRRAGMLRQPQREPSRGAASDMVRLQVESLDPELPMRLMATSTLAPGLRRRIHNGGVLVYEGTTRRANAHRPGVYDFVAQFGSRNAAGLFANWLWNELHGVGALLLVDGLEVPMENAAIKEAMLATVVY